MDLIFCAGNYCIYFKSNKMKKLILVVAIFATASVQQTFAQDTSSTQSSDLLTSYYNIKDALVSSDANMAAVSAEQFVRNLKSISAETVQGPNKEALLKDAGKISDTKNLKKQREYFSTFSANMYALSKTVKFSLEPIYYQYCPMKQATWLSSSTTIKNPYYGDAMLTCGKVTETIQ